MIWIPTVSGRPIDLVEPNAAHVDFREMAHALAHLNRYAGHGQVQVSVALHLLIGLNLCPEHVKPYWLLHDGHEWALGEITTPALQALRAIADDIESDGGALIRAAVVEFKRRHDAAIHAAAGLPIPSPEIRERIIDIDMRCLAIEHRDFHRPSALPWAHELLNLRADRSIRKFQQPDKIADQLAQRFETYLPALRSADRAALRREA